MNYDQFLYADIKPDMSPAEANTALLLKIPRSFVAVGPPLRSDKASNASARSCASPRVRIALLARNIRISEITASSFSSYSFVPTSARARRRRLSSARSATSLSRRVCRRRIARDIDATYPMSSPVAEIFVKRDPKGLGSTPALTSLQFK